jgi:hypothetical protein
MSKITIKQAMQLTGKSDSTLRRDMRAGKVSYTKDDKGKVILTQPKRSFRDFLKVAKTAQNAPQALKRKPLCDTVPREHNAGSTLQIFRMFRHSKPHHRGQHTPFSCFGCRFS